MENDDKLQKVKTDASEDVQNSTELNEHTIKEEEREDASPENTAKIENQPPKEVIESAASGEKAQQQGITAQQTTEEAAETVFDLENPEANQAEGSRADMSESEEEGEAYEDTSGIENADKKELLSKLRKHKNEDDIKKLDKMLRAIKPRFDELYELAKNEALQKFVSGGSEADSFEYHESEEERTFIALYGQLRTRRNKHFKDLSDQKEDNLKKKERS